LKKIYKNFEKINKKKKLFKNNRDQGFKQPHIVLMCAATEHTLFESKWQYVLHQEAGTAALNDIHYESFVALLTELPNYFLSIKLKKLF